MEEGNYASLEKSLCSMSANSDLGLTLLPGLQIQREDEKRLGTTAKSTPRKVRNKYDEIYEQSASFGAEIRGHNLTQVTAVADEARNTSSSPFPGSEPATPSHVKANLNREHPFHQNSNVKNDSSVVPYNANSADAALSNEQRIGTREIRCAKSCQHGNYSSRVVKWKKLGSRAYDEIRSSKVNKRKEAAVEPHYNRSHMHYDQGQSEHVTIQPAKTNGSFAITRLPLSGTGKSSKPESHRRITRSLDVICAYAHQRVTNFQRNSSPTVSFVSGSPAKHSHSKIGGLTSSNLSKVSRQRLKHLRPQLDTTVNIRAQVLRCEKRVNRSWTTFFPAKASFSGHANPPASFLAAPFTPSGNDQYHYLNNPLTSTNINIYPYTNFSSTPPSNSSPKHPGVSKAFDYPIDIYAFEGSPNTACAGDRRQSAPRRSASMPNLSSTPAPTNMGSFNKVGAASMPTPPRETPRISLDLRKTLAQASITQDVVGPSIPRDSTMSAGGLQDHRQRLELKPNYSCEEVKSLMFDFIKQSHIMKAENASLQSSNVALRKGVGSLQFERAEMFQKIQRYERTVTQKDQQIESIRQKGMSLQRQYKQVWNNYHRLVAALRKENGTGNPSAIAQRIRRDHDSDTIGAASQGDQPSTIASSVNLANCAQLSISRPESEQIPSGFQRYMQSFPVPGPSGADVTDASSQGCPSTNPNRTNPLRTVSIPAHSEADLAHASSRASVTPGFAAAKRNSVNSPHDRSARCIQANLPSETTVGTVTTRFHTDKRPMGHVSPERITIDLTDESQLPLFPASCNPLVHQTTQSGFRGGCSPFNILPGQYSPAQCPAVICSQSQHPSAPSAQDQDLESQLPPSQGSQSLDREAMQIQSKTYARMAEKSLSWLQGENPFRKGTKTEQQSGLPNPRRLSQGKAEDPFVSTNSRKEGTVAPLPETATGRQPRSKVPKKARAVLTVEAKKERARVYRKTAADRKKQEKGVAKQLHQGEDLSTNAMRAQKQDRRATKMAKRQEQARDPSGGIRPWEAQKTLGSQLNREYTGVLQTVHSGSMEQAPSDDHDSLFEDDADDQMEIEASKTSSQVDGGVLEDDADSAYVAELEAQLLADADAATSTGFGQVETLGGDDGDPDGPCESEESEED